MSKLLADPAVSLCFQVVVDGKDLGTFFKCDGLGVQVSTEEREEGGNNFYVHQLAGRLRYTNVTLTRYISAETQKVAQWFASMATGVKRTTAVITAMTSDLKPIASWNLIDVIPVLWTGPSLGVDATQAATETLELAHHGFLDPGKA
ncbi:MAG TPA: phage tail protein [Acidimicrobiales bacterium]|nr:phage tail protein [Acidimicrobiales bacterium]